MARSMFLLQATGDWPEDGTKEHYFTSMKALRKFCIVYYGADITLERMGTNDVLTCNASENAPGYSHSHHFIYAHVLPVYCMRDDLARLAIMGGK